MYNLTLDQPAEDMLIWLKSRDKKTHARVVVALDELQQTGIIHPQIHKIFDPSPIYRRRIGRWRIIFTSEPANEIAVWIIDIEKDTKKDYSTWITKLKHRRKLLLG